jgi:16S rRNA (guanine(966)-N(2))-methyltransferase RsmD
MRVIGGIARGRKLKRVPGDTTRPIMDRVKESLFNILAERLPDSRWLDMFAGTGQVGIEALSRGAAEVVFLDTARLAIETIRDNLRHVGLEAGATVLRQDAFAYLAHGSARPFDLIYVAPPQYKGIWKQAVELINAGYERCLTPDGLVVVQIDPQEHQDLLLEHLDLVDSRRYGNTRLSFYERRP